MIIKQFIVETLNINKSIRKFIIIITYLYDNKYNIK